MRARLHHPVFGTLRRQRGLLLASSSGGGGGGFSVPTPPASSTATKVPLNPNFTEGATGLDPYRPWSVVTIDGITFVANGWDPPKRWDGGANFFPMGSTAPTTFALALSAAGSPAALANGNTAVYYLVFATTFGKETAPQVASASITNSSGGTRDVTVTWVDPGGEWAYARIYRRLQGTDDFKLVSQVNASAATYLDASTDASLATATAYIDTYRITLPPNFVGLAVHQGRMFGWPRDEAIASFGQTVRVDDRFVADDFKSDALLPIGSDEGTGGIRAMVPYFGSALWFKRRSIYEMTGSSATTFEIRRMSKDRGAINPRCIVSIYGRFVILDELGVYEWIPGGEPVVAGATLGTRQSPLQSIFDRMNLAASDTFHAVHNEAAGLVIFYVALDYEPIPNVAVVFDYRNNRFVGIDTGRWSTAAGHLEDAQGVRHLVRGCDMGKAWEDDYAASEGVFAGDSTGTITAGSKLTVTASGAALNTSSESGGAGCPFDRYSSAGVVVDENRVYSVDSSTALTLYLYPSAAYSANDTFAIGVIRGIVGTPRLYFRGVMDQMAWVREFALDHGNGVNGTLRADTGLDESALARNSLEPSLLTNTRSTFKCDGHRALTWRVEISQRYANLGYSLRGLHVHYDIVPEVATK